MNSKALLVIVLVAICGFILWCATGNKNTVVQTAAENVKLSVEEAVLPEQGKPDDAAVIRKAMIEQRKKENSEWTASNIHARPDLYLAHCQKMLSHYHEQYGAAIIETKTEINKYEREIQNAEETCQSFTGFLLAAQKALKDPSFQYPGKVGLYTYGDSDQVKSAVLKTDKKLTEVEGSIAGKKRSVVELKSVLAQLEKGKERVGLELQGLNAKVGQVKSGTIKKNVDQIRDRIDALLSGVDALPQIEDAPPSIGASETITETADDVFKRRKMN